MWTPFTQFAETAVTRKSGRIANEFSKAPVIRMLVLDTTRRQHQPGHVTPQQSGNPYRVRRFHVQMRIAVEINKTIVAARIDLATFVAFRKAIAVAN